MWYVIQTASMQEEKIRRECEKRIGKDILERCILPEYEEKIRYGGQWHIRKKRLFPGYLFLISDQIGRLYEKLHKIEGTAHLLKTGESVVPLTEKEVCLMRHLLGENEVLEMSEGILVNDRVEILSGPLQGLESTIRKLDRHKRKAWLNLEMFGREQMVEVGVEILRKVEG